MLIFLIQVWKMRCFQIAFFRHRKQIDLIEAKRYEKLVDAGLMRYLIITDQGEPVGLAGDTPSPQPSPAGGGSMQGNLFTEDEDEADR